MAHPTGGYVDAGATHRTRSRQPAGARGDFTNRVIRKGAIRPDVRLHAETLARESRAAGLMSADPAIRKMFLGGFRKIHPNSTAARTL